ncbi:MAG: hypothetical protein EZS28_001997 [Streblomastix strix]|uniref:Uncharacterized protein n=1 Tax=Streblomastix strix TaxID=222440 RepID=A0A5J4X5G9_9EUKA|nr:MAG: hypothetical protein EZS28_001997 [Streblomastix strix]
MLIFAIEIAGIFHKIKQIAQKFGQGANWASQHIYMPLKPYIDALAPPIVSKNLQAASSGLDVIYANNAQDRIMNLANFRNDVGVFIEELRVRQSIENNRYIRLHPNVSRNINRAMGTHITIPSNQTVNGTQYNASSPNSNQAVGEEDFQKQFVSKTIKATLQSNSVDAFRNDGELHYSIKEINPESQMPALFDKEILISLSDSDHDVTQIQNSFLSIVLTANVQFDSKFEGFEESNKDGTVLFIGFKLASQVIREYTIYHRERTIDGTLQNNSTTEQFIYNTIKPKSEKKQQKTISFIV